MIRRCAVQTQSYGREARGGASKSEVVIAAGEIDHPEVLSRGCGGNASARKLRQYAASVKPGGLLIVDDDNVHSIRAPQAIKIPISWLAYHTTGIVHHGQYGGRLECWLG